MHTLLLRSSLLLALAAAPLATLAESNTAMQQEYDASMQRMHADMHHGVMSSDPDVAFAAGMLPHHQGAVEMARIQLKYGKDPQMRQLAERVIEAQEAEIRELQDWLKAHTADHTGH